VILASLLIINKLNESYVLHQLLPEKTNFTLEKSKPLDIVQ